MENWFWTIAILLIHPHQKIIGPENAFAVDFKSPETFHFEAGAKQHLDFHPGLYEFSTHPLELTQLNSHQSTLAPFPTTFVEPIATDSAFWDPYSSHLEPHQLNDLPSLLPHFPAAFGEPGSAELALGNRYGSHLQPPQLDGLQSPLPPLPAIFWEHGPTAPAVWDQNSSHLEPPQLNGPLPPLPAIFCDPGSAAPALWDPYASHLEPTQLIGPQSPLPPLPASFGEPGPTELPQWNLYGSHHDSFVQSSTFHFDPDIFLGSTSHDVIPETNVEVPSSKRNKIQMLSEQNPFTLLNYIPSNYKPSINARSQPLGGPPAASTNPNYYGAQISHEPGLVYPMIFSPGVDCTQDHPVLPILNHQSESYQTDTHQRNNLSQNPNHVSNHPMGTSKVRLEPPGFLEKCNDQLSRAFNNAKSETSAKKTMKRKRIKSHPPVPAPRRASTASQGTRRSNSLRNTFLFDYRWTDFKPSTNHGKLVIEVLDNVKLEDGTNFFNFIAGISRAQELDDTIQNKWPNKMFCLEPSPLDYSNQFFDLIDFATRSPLSKLDSRTRDKLCTITRQRFILPDDQHCPHQDKILAYKTHALSEFMELVETSEKSVVPDYHNINLPMSIFFQEAIKLVPIYLFYVDLISTLVPVQNLDMEGKVLQNQREIAGKCFLKLIQEIILHDKKAYSNYDREDRKLILIDEVSKILQKGSLTQNHTWSIMWRAIEYWALNSREDLMKVHKFKGRYFKKFFNRLVFYWAAKKTFIIPNNDLQVTWNFRKGENLRNECVVERKKRRREFRKHQ